MICHNNKKKYIVLEFISVYLFKSILPFTCNLNFRHVDVSFSAENCLVYNAQILNKTWASFSSNAVSNICYVAFLSMTVFLDCLNWFSVQLCWLFFTFSFLLQRLHDLWEKQNRTPWPPSGRLRGHTSPIDLAPKKCCCFQKSSFKCRKCRSA